MTSARSRSRNRSSTNPASSPPQEWDLIKTHPSAGASLLPADRVSALSIAIVRDHHERWDGGGYEQSGALEQETSTQFARIAAVADVYDAVTADRPYKAANPPSRRRPGGPRGCGQPVRPRRRAAFPARRDALPGGLHDRPAGWAVTGVVASRSIPVIPIGPRRALPGGGRGRLDRTQPFLSSTV